MISKIETWIRTREVILIILALVVLLRIPSLFEPYWYGDEGIYLTVGRAMRQGVELYRGIYDNKPPLIYTLAVVADGKQFWFKFILMLWGVATVAVFWNVSRCRVWPTAIFALLTTLPLLEGNIANAELFFLLLTVGAFGLVWKDDSLKNIFGAGILYGVAGLFKTPGLLEAAVWPTIWLVSRDKEWLKKSGWMGVGAAIPMGLAAIYFLGRGTLPEFITAAGVKMIPYLSSWNVNLPVVGTLWGRAILLVSWLVGLWLVRRKIPRTVVIMGVWWGITLFAALLSGRPYPHYLLQMVPVVSLAVGAMLWKEKKGKLVWLAMAGVTIAAVVGFKFYVYPLVSYCQNWGKWVLGQQSHEAYMQWFNPQVKNNYEIAKFIKAGSGRDERIFVWGDEPMIYALSRRLPATKYTVEYHVKEFGAQKATGEKLKEMRPRYVVFWGDGENLPGLAELLKEEYILETKVGEAQVYRLFGHRL